MSRMEKAIVITVVLCALGSTELQAYRMFGAPRNGPAYLGSEELSDPVPVDNWEALVSGGHRFGPDKAAVELVEFADFECPACRQFHQTSLQMLQDSFPDQVAIIYRHWTLDYHKFAIPAARAFECAAIQGRGLEMHDLMYEKQDSLGLKPFSDFARDAGVPDTAMWRECDAGAVSFPQIAADVELVRSLGGRGTPTVIINGLRFPRVPDRGTLRAFVDSVLQSQ